MISQNTANSYLVLLTTLSGCSLPPSTESRRHVPQGSTSASAKNFADVSDDGNKANNAETRESLAYVDQQVGQETSGPSALEGDQEHDSLGAVLDVFASSDSPTASLGRTSTYLIAHGADLDSIATLPNTNDAGGFPDTAVNSENSLENSEIDQNGVTGTSATSELGGSDPVGNATFDGGSTRHVRIDTQTVTRNERPLVKLVFVIDNSYSMADKQERLATAMGHLADQMRGYNLEVSLYTTTSYDQNRLDLGNPGKGTVQSLLETIDASGVSTPGHLDDTAALLPHTLSNSFHLVDPFNGGNLLSVSASASAGEFSEFRSRFMHAIVDIGTAGSDTERGLCTLAYVMNFKQSTTAKLNLQLGDLVGYIVLSDEDEQGHGLQCHVRSSSRHFAGRPMYSEVGRLNPPAVFQRVFAEGQATTLDGLCRGKFHDGVRLEGLNTDAYLKVSQCRRNHEICMAGAAHTPCSNAQSEYLNANFCAPNRLGPPVSCFATPTTIATYGTAVEASAEPCTQGGYRRVQVQADASGPPTAVPIGDVIASPWLQMARELSPDDNLTTCGRYWVDYTQVPTVQTENIDYRAFDANPGALNAAAARISGERGYFIAAIINTNDSVGNAGLTCTLRPHESMGTAYGNVVAVTPPGQGVIHPICSEDYAPALEPLRRFLTQTVDLSYVVPDLLGDESITGIALRRGRDAQVLTLGIECDVVGSRMTFKEGTLLPGDVIEASIVTNLGPTPPRTEP